MSFFDRTLRIRAASDGIWRALEEMTTTQKVLVSKPNTILLTTDNQYGYLYVVREMPDGTINLRHILATYEHVKEAFRTARGQEALKLVIQPTRDLDESLAFFAEQEAEERLQELAQKFTPKPAQNPSTQPSLRQFLKDKPTGEVPTSQPNAEMFSNTEEKFKAGTPWNPLTISGYMFFVSTIGVGIGLGINWRRLGKPEWTLGTILLTFAIPFSTILIAFSMINRISVSPLVGMALAMGGFGLNIGFMYAMVYLQHGAYKKWQAVGHTAALKAYPYNFTNAGLIVLGITSVVAVGGAVLANNQLTPQEFDGTFISFTYPKSWGQYPASDYGDFCDDYGCEAIISDTRFRYTHMLFVRVPLRQPESAQEYETDSWDYISSSFDVEYVSEQTMTIDGHEAVILEYLELDHEDAPLHVMHVYVADGDVMWTITAYARNTGIFNEDRRDIQNILTSIDF